MTSDQAENQQWHPADTVDLDSRRAVPYWDYARAKGWTRSTGHRRKLFLPVLKVIGFPDMIVPFAAETVLRGEPLDRVRPRGRPRRGAAR